jgi:DNA repair photolyase
MGKLSKSRGNMYDWVTHMWSPLTGCPHQCSYCYVKNSWRDLPEVPTLEVPFPNLGSGKTIFIGHLCDMFAEGVNESDVLKVLEHCRKFDNEYVFQTKNPEGVWKFKPYLPEKRMFGTTIETNREDLLKEHSKAPDPISRANGLGQIEGKKFVTIEPIMDFDVPELLSLIVFCKPDFVNIGADSKRHNLPEPTAEKITRLVQVLGVHGITIRKKVNMERLLK